jgi:hypothetical protein
MGVSADKSGASYGCRVVFRAAGPWEKTADQKSSEGAPGEPVEPPPPKEDVHDKAPSSVLKPPAGSAERNEDTATAPYCVTAIRDSQGTLSFEAIFSGDLRTRQKKLNEEYAEACKSWAAARKRAVPNGGSYAHPAPKTPILHVLQRVRGKSQAEKLAGDLKNKWEAKQRKTGGKEGDEPANPQDDRKAEEAKPNPPG